MRKLPLLFALLLLALLVVAPSTHASPLTAPVGQVTSLLDPEEEEAESEEPEAEEAEDPEEVCEFEEEETCEEEEPAPKGKRKDDECALKSAKAAVTVNPGKRRLRLTVHYRTWKPASVSVEASLHGAKGAVHLGTDHSRFRRSGVYRDTFQLAEKQTKKALAARELSVDLHVLNTPPSCSLHLTEAVRRAKRSRPAGEPGRSGGQARTRDR